MCMLTFKKRAQKEGYNVSVHESIAQDRCKIIIIASGNNPRTNTFFGKLKLMEQKNVYNFNLQFRIWLGFLS